MANRTTYKNQIPLDNSRTEYDFRWQRKSISSNYYFAIQKRKTQKLRHDAIFKSTNLEVLKNQTIEENLTANIEQSELKETTTRVLSSLTPREERVLRMRFGFSNNNLDYTLEEVAQHYKVSRERIRQVEAKALRKLKHPSRSIILKPYLNATSIN